MLLCLIEGAGEGGDGVSDGAAGELLPHQPPRAEVRGHPANFLRHESDPAAERPHAPK